MLAPKPIGYLGEMGYFAPIELLDPALASGAGDLTMHNVEGDPLTAGETPTFDAGPRSFISWYSAGLRAVEYRPGHWHTGNGDVQSWNVHEVGRFIAPDGSNFWGVHVDEHAGEQIILKDAAGSVIRDFLPWAQVLCYLEAIVRVYNRYGRRDNAYKARIKILVKAEGQRFMDDVQREFAALIADGAPTIPQSELDRVSSSFVLPPALRDADATATLREDLPPAYLRWLERNVHAHRVAGYRAVTLSLKRAGLPPGDVTAAQMDGAAALAERFSAGELRVTHEQNLVLPWVRQDELPALWQAARDGGFATANIGLLTDMIACPGGDLCALANARSMPIAAALTERFADLDEQHDIGDIDLHISGCINSCGHHHSGHIGILGVDKDGSEWYQLTLGGSDGSTRGGPAVPGRVIGPAFAADEVPDALEAVLDLYRRERAEGERFVDVARRLGPAPFRAAADAVRRTTARDMARDTALAD